jgi:hypothetical protein
LFCYGESESIFKKELRGVVSVQGLRAFMEIQCCRVHAVAFSYRRRTVIKDMAEMCPAPGAEHFGTHLPARGIGMSVNVEFGYRSGETGPAGTGIEFCDRFKQVSTATGTGIDALLFEGMIFTGEGMFCALFSGHVILFRSEECPPLCIGFYYRQYLFCVSRAGIVDRNYPVTFHLPAIPACMLTNYVDEAVYKTLV